MVCSVAAGVAPGVASVVIIFGISVGADIVHGLVQVPIAERYFDVHANAKFAMLSAKSGLVCQRRQGPGKVLFVA